MKAPFYKTFNYLLYKISNQIISCLTTRKVQPLLRVKNNTQLFSPSAFYFDLSHKTTHNGDRLFMIPLIVTLIRSGYKVKINPFDEETINLLGFFVETTVSLCKKVSIEDLVIYPRPSYANFRHKYIRTVLVDFTDTASRDVITKQLIMSLSKYLNINLQLYDAKMQAKSTALHHAFNVKNKYIIFNNYIDSGSFRKHFVDESKLSKKAIELKQNGYLVVHVGSKLDLLNDKNIYSFVDIDLRGKTSIHELVSIIFTSNVVGAVSYDNFLMHLIGISGKFCFVLFRGRFLKSNRVHHYLKINNTFYSDNSKLDYV